jgi:integrase/recombinase XerD
MNHSSSGSLALRKAIIGFSNHKTAEGLTERSVDSYKRDLEQWAAYAGDIEVAQITKQDIEANLFYLRTEYVPHRFGGDTQALSPKTLRNIYITLASFFTWASREFRVENLMKEIPAPRFQNAPIEPFTQDDVQRMLKACIYSREADPINRRRFVMRRPTANRDQAIILTLVDTGLRALELCSLKIENFDPSAASWRSSMAWKEGQRAEKAGPFFLARLPGRLSGVTLQDGRMKTNRMRPCLPCLVFVLLIRPAFAI